MKELIPIIYKDEQPTVSARELYAFLGLQERYSKWFERMVEYGFNQSVDYTPYQTVHPQNMQPMEDHQLTIDMAKELCMIQRTEKGKQARQYFLSIEKAWNDPTTLMARALKVADQKILRLSEQIEEYKPKVLFADAVEASDTAILVGELAKLIKQNGVDIGQNRLFEWMRGNGYLIRRSGADYNMPTQYSMELGLFEIKERAITNPDGSARITKTAKVTGKGQQYFINKFLGGSMPTAHSTTA
ncbi:phage antirepressor KilAC domain-containing protein [Ruminococcaceae bacterium OttesenSCG-928-I18]|nr:phage antirepressor KilAC domain-containing protein [Ruminococcaceae bacterium OttesenSCG-928-I18]